MHAITKEVKSTVLSGSKYFLIPLILSLLMAGCDNKPQTPLDNLSLGVDVTTLASAPVFVAEAKGLWKGENLNVEIKPFVSGRLALDGLLATSVNVATVADVPVVLAALQQQQVRIIATFSSSEKHVNLLARKDRGIFKPEDLRGKRIAVPLGTNAEYVMELFLQRSRLSQSDVQIVSLNPPDTVGAITRGDVDAIFAWQPHIYNAQKLLGTNAIVFSSEGIYNQPFNLVVMEDYLGPERDKLTRLMNGLKRAEIYIHENRAESIEIVARRLQVDAKDLEAIWDSYSFALGLDSALVGTLKNEGIWAKKAGIVAKDAKEPDYQSIVYASLLGNLK
jgi:NitT/TauT family transport system substrate-binding protein